MCGIIGQLNFSAAVDRGRFDAMRDTLTHRGPDGYGTEIRDGGRLALGHRRLSILDLSERGHQPMSNEDNTVWITFNGEIYNYGPLRRELLASGHVFRSTSDTEVLVHGYEEWGLEDLLRRIKGMFAFGLWDENRRKLFVVRDRFGIKPLVYRIDNDRFVFASEIKAITRDPEFAKFLRPDALADFFLYSYVPHPHTVWEGIHKLRPAHYLEVDADRGTHRTVRYWNLPERVQPLPYAEARERMQELLHRSVREHLVSDVPVGLFLSGGLDSASVLLHMRDLGCETDAFSLGFAGSDRSEHAPAAAIAEALDARHHVKLLGYEDEVFPLIERLVRHYDEPFAVSSQLTYHYIAEYAAQTHKVVLGGDGGDELLAGYHWYPQMARWRPGPRSLLRALRGGAGLKEQQLEVYAREQTGVYHYLRSRGIVAPEWMDRMHARAYSYFTRFFGQSKDRIKSWQRLDIDTFMLDNCLQRADSSSMLHSLEVRVPFLDHELFEFVYSLPSDTYFQPHRQKKMLYDKLEPRLPPSVLDRKKQGFGFQHRDSLKGPAFEDFVNRGELRKLGVLARPADFSQLTGEEAYHLVFLEQWLRLNQI